MPTQPTVADVMTRNPAVVAPNDVIRAAVQRMFECKCRRLPVIDDGKLVGIISNIDLRRATNSPLVLRERWYDDFVLDHIIVRACMTPNPITVTATMPVLDAARLMRDRKIGGLPVVEGDRLVGIVTETDLLNYLIKTLEPSG